MQQDLSTLTNEHLRLIQHGSAWEAAKTAALETELRTLQERIANVQAELDQVRSIGFDAERVLNWRTRAGRTAGDIYAELAVLEFEATQQDRPWRLAAITWSHDPTEPDTAIVTIHTPQQAIVITFDECWGIYPSLEADIGTIDADLRSFAPDGESYIFLVGDDGAEVSIHVIGKPLTISRTAREG